jgi:hypothetical protein
LTVAEQAARQVIDHYGLRARVLKLLRRGGADASKPAASASDE